MKKAGEDNPRRSDGPNLADQYGLKMHTIATQNIPINSLLVAKYEHI